MTLMDIGSRKWNMECDPFKYMF